MACARRSPAAASRTAHARARALCSADVARRNRRERTTFNQTQLDVLEHHFQAMSQYPDAFQRERLAEQVALAEPRVQV